MMYYAVMRRQDTALLCSSNLLGPWPLGSSRWGSGRFALAKSLWSLGFGRWAKVVGLWSKVVGL